MMASVKDDEKSNVVQNVLSHAAVAKKNLIVIHLIVSNSCINDIEYYQRIWFAYHQRISRFPPQLGTAPTF